MNVAAITGERDGGIVEKPKPVAKDNFVVVKVHAAPMCTEYQSYKKGGKSDTLGHEAAGEVVEVAQPGRVKAGDRVVVQPQYACGVCPLCLTGDHIHCTHQVDPYAATGSTAGKATYAQYLIKQDWLLTPIPDGMSYDHASMACCGLGPTFGAMELMNVNANDTVLISGLGPVGLGGVINARYRNARVIAVEINPWRAALAKRLGAEAVIDPRDPKAVEHILSLTDGLGVSASVETSGTPDSKMFLINAARRKGRVAFVGWSGQIDASAVIQKGLSVHGAWHYNIGKTHLLMEEIRRVSRELDMLITHTFPLSKVKNAWEQQLTGECGKIILHPWE